jgi:metal-responsive CopG/Arc/MetJ family transcriptional regulator
MRAHVFLPDELLEQVDKVAGKRKRSRFVEEAIREKLSRDALGKALEESAGVLKSYDYPDWETPEKTSAWVRSLRELDNERLERKLKGSDE